MRKPFDLRGYFELGSEAIAHASVLNGRVFQQRWDRTPLWSQLTGTILAERGRLGKTY